MALLEADALEKRFHSQRGELVHPVRRVGFTLREGEFLGLVGESGCGKSTVARLLAGLLTPDRGSVRLGGERLTVPYPKHVYRRLQMVFQTPRDSFDPRRTIGAALTEIQRSFGAKKKDARANAPRLLERVGLPGEVVDRYPHQLSGGECQRAAIARAVAVAPEILICDEITSALDVTTQAQIVELLRDLRERMSLSLLFISHDLALVQGVCDRILVMRDGEIVEEGTGPELLAHPKNEYTRALFSSVPAL